MIILSLTDQNIKEPHPQESLDLNIANDDWLPFKDVLPWIGMHSRQCQDSPWDIQSNSSLLSAVNLYIPTFVVDRANTKSKNETMTDIEKYGTVGAFYQLLSIWAEARLYVV